MSWVWLDGVDGFEKGRWVKAWKKWEAEFPQVYLVEMLAQAGAILLGLENDFSSDVVITKVQNVEILKRPEPGERLEIHVEADGLRKEGGWFQGTIEGVASGRVLLMNVGRLRPDGKGPITFPEPLIAALR